MHATGQPRPRLQVGSGAFWRANVALFIGGLITFAALYATQPLLPTFADEFAVSPATASLTLSVTSATLAIALVIASTLSETVGRKSMMVASLLASSVLTLESAFSPSFSTLLLARAAQGVVLAGLPAVAMAYLAEEVQAGGLGLAVGLYIGGNSIGGMTGRIATGLAADAFGWRVAVTGVGILSLICSLAFWMLLPPSAHFTSRQLAPPRALLAPLAAHLRDARLRRLYLTGFLLQAAFTSLYNYVSFDLEGPPYRLSQAAVGWIFLTYVFGTIGSALFGRVADCIGRRQVLLAGVGLMVVGSAITLAPNVPVKIAGIAVFTFAFFGAHATASGWVARHVSANRAEASALYLLLYYLGASIGGAACGLFWTAFGWSGVVGFIVVVLALEFSVGTSRAPEPAPSAHG
jgi:MFS transporter, YNFM family, putative membrane transport protein